MPTPVGSDGGKRAIVRGGERSRRPLLTVALVLLCLPVAGAALVPTTSAFSSSTGNSGSSFTAAASFGPSCTGPARSFTVVNGFESGVGLSTGSWSELGTGGGTVTSDTTVVRNGNRSMKVAQVAGGDAYLMQMAPSAQTVLVARWAMRFSVLPGDGDELFNVKNGGAVDMKLVFSGANKLAVEMSGTATSTSTIAPNTWYVIDVRYNVGANPHTVNWRINGVAQPSGSSATAATTLADMRWGSSSDSNAYTAFYDDLVLSHTSADYPIGDGTVLPLRPDGLGTHNTPASFQNNDNSVIDGTSTGRIDDDPLTATSDYLKQIAAGTGRYIELAFPDVNECVDGVAGTVAHHASGTTANAARTDIVVGAATTNLVTNMNSTSLKLATKKVAPSGASWTYTDLNNAVARFGYASSVAGVPYLDAVLLEYHVPV